jgi:uridine phosphorylase
MVLQHPAFLDKNLCEELLEIANQDKAYKSVIGKTMCTYDFYEGKGTWMLLKSCFSVENHFFFSF